MKKMSILTVSLLAVCGLIAAPVHAATVFATDTPDVTLTPGSQGNNIFNLNDFFDGAASYSATGGSVAADGAATVFGQASPGKLTATFTGDGVSVSSTVQVTQFMIGNAPAIDNNNRLAGVAGGNMFVNGIVPGSSVNSAMALSNLPAGGAGTPGGVTGAAALIATIGQVSLSTSPSGLRVRTSSQVATGAGSASAGGLTATLNANGSYTLAAANNFDGAYIVTFGAMSGASADGVHLLAARATNVALTQAAFPAGPAGPFALATVTYANNAVTVNAAQNQGALFFTSTPVPVGEYAIVSLTYTSNSANVNVAALAFDGALGSNTTAFTNPGTGNIDGSGASKNIALSVRATGGQILPGFQVFNGGASAASVTIQSLRVIHARPLVDYALNVNAKAASYDFAGGVAGWAQLEGSAPTANSANNFASGNAGSIMLSGAAGFANAAMTGVAAGVGTIVGEAYFQRSGAAAAGSAAALVITDGAANNMTTFVPGSAIPEGSWQKVICAGTNSVATSNFLVVQCAGFNGMVDDVSVRIINDQDMYFDATLLGV